MSYSELDLRQSLLPQVVDNGNGLSYDDLCVVGERYMTSKCHTVDDINSHFGYRGEAIASIVDVSGTVEICSRHRLSQNTYSKIFHNGKAMPVTASKSHRPSVGTTASVHDFFYNLPVRKRGISAALELEQVKRVMENIALINPSISFTMRNDATGECVVQIHKANSVMSRFGLLFGRNKTTAVKEVSLSRAGFELSGFMSTEGHHNKSLQFIYVNGRIVKKTPLHSCVNSIFANSLLTRKPSRVAESSCLRKEQYGVNELLSPRCTPDTFGVYVLHIKCPRSEYDICLEPAKTLIEFKNWDRITSAVEELVQDFLFKNNLTLALIHPATSNSLLDQQEDHQHFTSSMVNEDRSDVNPHLLISNNVDDLILAPSLESRTVRHPHLLVSAGGKHRKQGNSYLSQSKLLVHISGVDMTMMENERVKPHVMAGDGDNHTSVTTADDDHPVQEDLPNSITEDKLHVLPIRPPHVHSESGYHRQEGGEWSITDSRPLNSLPASKKRDKQPTTYNMNYDEASIYDTKQRPSVTHAISPAKVHANYCHQYPSTSSFITTYSCISNDSTYTSTTSAGQLVDKSHMQNDVVNSSNDSNSCALFMSSTETSNMQNLSPLTHISYRSPLQSSICSKLSKLFRSNPKKELTCTRSSSDRRKTNIKCQHLPPTSPVSCQSVSLEWKRSAGSCIPVAVSHSKLPHGEDASSPHFSPLANKSTCICTSSYISKPSCNGIHPVFTSAPAVVKSVHAVKHSQVSTTCALVGHPLSLGVCNIMPSYSLTTQSEPATASCHILCSTKAATNSCISRSLCETTTNVSHLASDSLIGRLDSKRYVHPDDLFAERTFSCIPFPEISKSTAITNQKDVNKDEHSILNTGFTAEIATHSAVETRSIDVLPSVSNCSSVTESPALIDFDSKQPVWKEITDPATGRTLYMHFKSGNCVSSLPHESSTSGKVHSFVSIFNQDNFYDSTGCGSLDNISSTDCLPSMDVTSRHSICLDTELSRNSLHHQKLNYHRITDRNSTSSSDLSISSLLANHQPWMDLPGTKWRHQSELHGCEVANCMSFDDIFKGWKNPTFQGGEEVS